MRVAIVGRGRLGTALGMAAQSAGHSVALLRRPSSSANDASPLLEAVLDASLDWESFDLVVLAFEKAAASVAELQADEALRHLQRIPTSTPVASVVMSPPSELVDALLPRHQITHFLTTPAARLPGAVALLPRTAVDSSRLKAALGALHWVEADEPEYRSLAVLMIGSALAAASLAHLGRVLGADAKAAGTDYLEHVLDDAKRLLRLSDGDGFRAFSLVATPGGFTENVHNQIFAVKWPLES